MIEILHRLPRPNVNSPSWSWLVAVCINRKKTCLWRQYASVPKSFNMKSVILNPSLYICIRLYLSTVTSLIVTFVNLLDFCSLAHARLFSPTFTHLSWECQWLGVFVVEHGLEVAHCFGKTILISLLVCRPRDWGVVFAVESAEETDTHLTFTMHSKCSCIPRTKFPPLLNIGLQLFIVVWLAAEASLRYPPPPSLFSGGGFKGRSHA